MRKEIAKSYGDYIWESLLSTNEVRWASLPSVSHTGLLESSEVELRAHKNKGIGVFTKKKIKKGTLFGYGGKVISKDELRRLQRRTSLCNYLISNFDGITVDARPGRDENNALWIGSKANGPCPGESFNCILVQSVPDHIEDRWPTTLCNTDFALCTAIDINANIELTTIYGWLPKMRTYEISYNLPAMPRSDLQKFLFFLFRK